MKRENNQRRDSLLSIRKRRERRERKGRVRRAFLRMLTPIASRQRTGEDLAPVCCGCGITVDHSQDYQLRASILHRGKAILGGNPWLLVRLCQVCLRDLLRAIPGADVETVETAEGEERELYVRRRGSTVFLKRARKLSQVRGIGTRVETLGVLFEGGPGNG